MVAAKTIKNNLLEAPNKTKGKFYPIKYIVNISRGFRPVRSTSTYTPHHPLIILRAPLNL